MTGSMTLHRGGCQGAPPDLHVSLRPHGRVELQTKPKAGSNASPQVIVLDAGDARVVAYFLLNFLKES